MTRQVAARNPAVQPGGERHGGGGFDGQPEFFPEQVPGRGDGSFGDQREPDVAGRQQREGVLADSGGAERRRGGRVHRSVD
jgi:hypothetical protein